MLSEPRNHISANGFQEQLQCSKLYGIGGANTYSCVTSMRRETRLRTGSEVPILNTGQLWQRFSARCLLVFAGSAFSTAGQLTTFNN